jgi:uncharacterized protein (DUF1778 family)
MAKTITVRLDDETYKKIKTAADSERRTISNFIESATLAYMENKCFVADEETEDIIRDKDLIDNLQRSIKDIKEERTNEGLTQINTEPNYSQLEN